MPIGNIDPFRQWAESANPSDSLWRQVAEVIFDVGDVPWRAPSTPQTFTEGQPTEIRAMPVAGTGLVILYEHRHADRLVTLLYVGPDTP